MFPSNLKRKIVENEELKKWTTIRTGGIAKYMFFPDNIDELIDMIDFINKNNLRYYILGKGSKVLFSDNGFDGIIINTKNLIDFKIKEDEIEVSCGYGLQNLLKKALENSLSGLEGLAGIPGSIGGALKMNAGSYGYEFGNVVKKIVILNNGNIKEEEYKYDYRKGLNQGIYLKAYLKLSLSSKDYIKEKISEFMEIKKKTQPLDQLSFGCVFKNPEGMSVWKLIKEAGCDRLKIGDAAISEMHSNFIVNLGNARTQDIIQIIKIIKEKVFEKFNIILEEEVNIVL